MEITYYRDAEHNYMVILCPQQEDTTGYIYRMMELNRIDGLLACSVRHIDGSKYLYYDITGKQSVESLYGSRKVPPATLWSFLRCLGGIRQSLSEYLLDDTRLMLDPPYIYYEFRTGKFCFTYLPGEEAGAEIFRFLADRIDTPDKQTIAAAYRMNAAARDDRIKIWEELGAILEEEEERKTEGAAAERSARAGSLRAADARMETRTEVRAEGRADTRAESYADTRPEGRAHTRPGGRSKPGSHSKMRSILMMILAAAGSGGLAAAQYFLYIPQRERRLCLVGAVLLMIIFVLLAVDLFQERKKRREKERRGQEPAEQESGEEYYPAFRGEAPKEAYAPEDEEETADTVFLQAEKKPGRLYGIGEISKGARIDLTTLPITIGKAVRYVDVLIEDPSVSRVHARVYRGEDGEIMAQDLGSTNGTYLNGRRIHENEPAAMARGDVLRIGEVEYEYR